MTVCFVTGTDTGVGKTVVTAALAVILRSRRNNVAVVKPAQTGVRPGEPGDIDEVRRLAGPLDAREGIRLPDPLAPDRAALVAGVELPGLDAQAGLILDAAASHDAVLVEGAGGVTVHLGQACTLLDIAGQVRRAGPPVTWIVVARAGLGTLNHANLTVRAIQDRGFAVHGMIIGSWPADPGPAELYNRHDLASHAGVPVLGAVPEGAAALPPPDSRPGHPAGSRPIADPLNARFAVTLLTSAVAATNFWLGNRRRRSTLHCQPGVKPRSAEPGQMHAATRSTGGGWQVHQKYTAEGLYSPGPREVSRSLTLRCLHKGLSGLTGPR